MLHLEQQWVSSVLRALSPAHGKFLPRIRGAKLHAEWSVCTFLARSRNCIMLLVAWHWIGNQICMGTKRIYIDLQLVSIFITKCIYLWSQGQPRWSEKLVLVVLISWLVKYLLTEIIHCLRLGYTTHCVWRTQLPCGVYWVTDDSWLWLHVSMIPYVGAPELQ